MVTLVSIQKLELIATMKSEAELKIFQSATKEYLKPL